jgi:hypothetical protein
MKGRGAMPSLSVPTFYLTQQRAATLGIEFERLVLGLSLCSNNLNKLWSISILYADIY